MGNLVMHVAVIGAVQDASHSKVALNPLRFERGAVSRHLCLEPMAEVQVFGRDGGSNPSREIEALMVMEVLRWTVLCPCYQLTQ